ncbi:MAG TPA: mechanosensitive ion channel domain-containing protein [Chthoniobacterales bacterium]|nr:mechanosensitive ion channel domain-containing protein [Chthoniobacterales bacterium]
MNLTLLERPLFYVSGHYVSFLGLIAFAALFGIGLTIARALQSNVVRRFLSRFKLETKFIAIVTTILSLAALVFFTVSAINAAGLPLSWSQPLAGINLSLLQAFLLVGLLIVVFWISSRTKRFLFTRFLANSGLDRSLQYAISQIIANIVLVIGVFIVLENTGIHLGALTVFAGAVGVGVGFGLQNIASNFISGLVILAERPITIGDRVEVAGIAGQVQQIRARSTVIMTNDNIAMIVPNTKFIDSPVTNWTYGDPRVRFRVPVGVAYGSDVNKVRDALIAAAREHPAALSDPPPNAFLDKFGASSIDFELVVWSREMSYRPRRFKSDLNYLIEKHLRAAGIEIPNPQRDLHIRSGVLRVENVDSLAAASSSGGEQDRHIEGRA